MVGHIYIYTVVTFTGGGPYIYIYIYTVVTFTAGGAYIMTGLMMQNIMADKNSITELSGGPLFFSLL